MSTFYETRVDSTPLDIEYPKIVDTASEKMLVAFRSILRSYTFLHLSFLSLLFIETLLLSANIFFLKETSLFAILLATLFLTGFSYILVVHYFQGKKPEEFLSLKQEFYQECAKSFPYSFEEEEKHLFLANSCLNCVKKMQAARIYVLSFPPFNLIEKTAVRLSLLLHWKDLVMLKEALLELSIQEYIEVVKLLPTDLSIHASLAHAYITLSQVYKKPNDEALEEPSFVDGLYKKLTTKFDQATQKAIEELKILDDLAPNDPWVHAQLASCYHTLQMSEEEVREYEFLLLLRPKDKDILHRLGLLYFQIGKTAKALSLYESLKELDAALASHLIKNYR